MTLAAGSARVPAGALSCKEPDHTHDQHHHEPPTHGSDLCARHRSPFAACRVVDHRDEGIAVIPASAPASRRGADEYKNPGAAVAAPGTEAKLPEHHAPPPAAPRGKRRR